MEIKLWVDLILKRLWLILVLPFAALSITAYISFFILAPVYESYTTLYVLNTNIDPEKSIAYDEALISPQMVKDYRELIRSKTVLTDVIEQLGLTGITPAQLAGSINLNLKNDTRIIEIKVKSNDSNKAKEIADEVGGAFIQKLEEFMKVENVYIVDGAEVQESPVSPKPFRNIAIAFLAGLFVAGGIVFFLEYMDDSIRTSEDVEEHLGLKVIGIIPELNIK